jgi:hypothetical protein
MFALPGAAFAQNQNQTKSPSQPQLVVIPKGHTRPVPYEAVRAWETGKYLNFFRLPNVNATIEPRERFNRFYGVHALEWLKEIERLSPVLHQDLIRAARSSPFRIVNEYITWQHEPYPQGEIDYKSFEKAAFYNGEIIFSTPVMDRVGPLSTALSAEQNQGFIVVHELINAAYPQYPVPKKLKIGEALIRTKLLHQGPMDVAYELGSIDPYFIRLQGTEAEFMGLLDELIRYATPSDASALKERKEIARRYVYGGRPLPRVFAEDGLALSLSTSERPFFAIDALLKQKYRALQMLGFEFKGPLIDLAAIIEIAAKRGVSVYDLVGLVDPVTGRDFREEGMKEIASRLRGDFLADFSGFLDRNWGIGAKGFLQGLLNDQHAWIEGGSTALRGVSEKRIKAWLQERKGPYSPGSGELSLVAQRILDSGSDPAPVFERIQTVIRKFLCDQKFCLNESKTRHFLDWLHQSESVRVRPSPGTSPGTDGTDASRSHGPLGFPFQEGDHFYRGGVLYTVLRVNSSREEITVLREVLGDSEIDCLRRLKGGVLKGADLEASRRTYGRNERDRDFMQPVYSIRSNLSDLVFLDP